MNKFAVALLTLAAISTTAFAIDRPSENRNYELRDVETFDGQAIADTTVIVDPAKIILSAQPLTASEARRLERGNQGGSGR
jgi:hypothetical protein